MGNDDDEEEDDGGVGKGLKMERGSRWILFFAWFSLS